MAAEIIDISFFLNSCKINERQFRKKSFRCAGKFILLSCRFHCPAFLRIILFATKSRLSRFVAKSEGICLPFPLFVVPCNFLQQPFLFSIRCYAKVCE